jgi:methionyl-tRNA synthetase
MAEQSLKEKTAKGLFWGGLSNGVQQLLKFKIADGLENRTIVSGIAQHYKPEELVGKQVLFIANLAPRQFKNGLVSEGMILSAENFDGTLAVTSLLREVKPGSEVK